ncbi:MAG: hypothetical protein DRI90_20855 [Deltaproteobacteria bacterium]|nr:MAG: hypothetical protein DRI90_20855 [Deltaproteobacteria bacterium]
MVYRGSDIINLGDLLLHERLAFGALIGVVLTTGPPGGPAVKQMLEQLAAELGADEFWAIVDEANAVSTGPDHAHELATEVKRRPVQVLIYTAVAELAMPGSICPDEMAVLDELRRLWGLEERGVSSVYRDD